MVRYLFCGETYLSYRTEAHLHKTSRSTRDLSSDLALRSLRITECRQAVSHLTVQRLVKVCLQVECHREECHRVECHRVVVPQAECLQMECLQTTACHRAVGHQMARQEREICLVTPYSSPLSDLVESSWRIGESRTENKTDKIQRETTQIVNHQFHGRYR